jgi:hypothetical protein
MNDQGRLGLPPGSAIEEEDEAGSWLSPAAWVRQLNGGTLAALVAGSAAIFLASVPFLCVLSKPLSLLGLLLGVLAGAVPALWKRANLVPPGAVSALSLLALLFVGSWPQAYAPRPPLVAAPLRQAGMVAHQPIQDDDWVDAAANAVRRDDLRVQVLGARVGGVETESRGRKAVSSEKYLVIRVRVSYEGIVFRQVPYEPWVDLPGSPSNHPAVLVDDLDQAYPQKTFDADRKVVGRGGRDYLTPGRQVNEVLVFPVPVSRTQYVRLKLPASAFGGAGEFRFQIPRSMIGGF